MPIDPQTRLGAAHLIVRDLDTQLKFYQQALGFCVKAQDEHSACLGSRDAGILMLEENPAAARPVRSTGLYHFAVLLPNRAALARSLWRLVDYGCPLDGAADHAVSEALYLSDPEGNGIELYRDRDRTDWPMRDGKLAMYNAPIDLDTLLAQSQRSDASGEVEPTARIGHIHLRVAAIAETEAFYVNVLGFDLTQHYGGSAAFVSAGGYHHHIGMNTWDSLGAPPAPDGSLGLRRYELLVPGAEAYQQLLERLHDAGHPTAPIDGGLTLRDPAGIEIALIQQP